MMTQNADKKRGQVQFLCMDDMVPQDHLLRNAFLHLFVVGPCLYMSGIHKNLTGINEFKFITLHQDMGKYLSKKIGILKSSGIDSTSSTGGDPKEFTDDIPKDAKTIKFLFCFFRM